MGSGIANEIMCSSSRCLKVIWKVIICGIIMKRKCVRNEKPGMRGRSTANRHQNIIGNRGCKRYLCIASGWHSSRSSPF